ncbi:MAG: T9SS type A sorting domain-containing protein [Elusimicrobia bacterium]|nr:T9SS type A sorting domain-containing protein [Elusimicrobiota bacterium]
MARKKIALLIPLCTLFVASPSVWGVQKNREHILDSQRFGLNRALSPRRKLPTFLERRAFQDFNQQYGNAWHVRYHPRTGIPESLLGGRTTPRGGRPEEIARRFLSESNVFLKINPSDLKLDLSHFVEGIHHLQFKQSVAGIPVEFGSVKVHLTALGEVIALQSRFEPDTRVSLVPSISESQALDTVSRDLGSAVSATGHLVLFPSENDGQLHLAWKFKVDASRPMGKWYYYVDAHTEEILLRYNDLRFACPVTFTSGTVTGMVYSMDPFTTPSPVQAPFKDQKVWVLDESTYSVTDNSGQFCSPTPGRVFTSLKGPFVHVAHQKLPSVHYDNGSGLWSTRAEAISSSHPYPNNLLQISTISLAVVASGLPAGSKLVKVAPVFSRLEVGAIDANGNLTDDDQLSILDSSANAVASYFGNLGALKGAAVEGKEYVLQLKTNSSGQQYGYDITFSSYLVLCPGGACDAATSENSSSTFTWTASRSADNTLDEINAFYQANQYHDYLAGGVNASSNVPINFPVNVMVHAGPGGLENAFYDPDFDHLFFGDGTTPAQSSALDATVVRHELTHFTVNHIYPIINFGQFGAISEGLADYFSGSSLNSSMIGRGLGGGIAIRNLDDTVGGNNKVFPANWVGEIHDDSLIISQAFWDIRTSLGSVTADLYIFHALYFYPDSFQNFRDAVILACAALNGGTCSLGHTTNINNSFSAHGIPPAAGDSLEPNDGLGVATDISTRPTLSATLYPDGDLDTYTFVAGVGKITATLTLPERPSISGNYFAYGMFLFDQNRVDVMAAYPPFDVNPVNTSLGPRCPDPDGFNPQGQCYTQSSGVTLEYTVTQPGRFYLMVSAGLTAFTSNGHTNSILPYGLEVTFAPESVFSGSVVGASFDNDIIGFSASVASFSFVGNVLGLGAQEYSFQYAQLRDQGKSILPLTDTRQPGSFLTVVFSSSSLGQVSGRLQMQPGFAQRFPAVGTVFLEVFGVDHSSVTHSLGLSNPINLTTNQAALTAWNNIFKPEKGQKATIKYELQQGGAMTLKLYTLAGQLVKVFFDGQAPSGKGSIDWAGVNEGGDTVASGIYLLRLEAPGIQKTQKIIVIK